LKQLIKKIPQIKQICDERDNYQQSLLIAQSELEQLHQRIQITEKELERVNHQYDLMENDLIFERQQVAEIYKKYNEMEIDFQLMIEKTIELERVQHKYNEGLYKESCDNETMEFNEYTFWVNDHFVNDAVNHKQEFFNLYNMLDDDKSKKVFNWVVGYRIVCSLLHEPLLWEAKKPSKLYEMIPCTTGIDTFYETYEKAMNDNTSCLHAEHYSIWHTFYLEHYRYDELFKINDGDIVFDIGGYVGDTALYFSRKVQSGHVYTFEPDKQHANKINENIKHFSINNISVIEKGVSDYSGTAGFSKFGASGGSIKDEGEQQIEVIELDKFVEDKSIFVHDKIDLIKLDIEGFELDALTGAESVIREYRPILLISVYHTRLQDNSEYIIKPGYGDLIPISKYIKEKCKDYRFSLRHKNCGLFETLLICVPK